MIVSPLYSIAALFSVTASFGSAAPISTCQDQWPCLRFTYDALPSNECVDEQCEYQVCMVLDYSGSCSKTDTVSHTCEKPESGVCLDCGGFEGASTEVANIGNGYTSCQIVKPGGIAEFLLKDGNAPGGCGDMAMSLLGGVPLTCETLDVKSCTGNGNIGKECMWKITAPTSCGKNGGGGGDPHFKLWNRERYMYHGECDLVLVKSSNFAQGLGLDLHVRTTINDFYSYVEAAALRIGETVLEVSEGKFWVDGKEGNDEDLPISISGFTMHAPYTLGTAKVYRLDLNQGDKILFRNYKHFLTVDVSGNLDDFGESVGLLGDYAYGRMLARDGTTVLTDPNIFGQEWQVQEDEPMLFSSTRDPQHPTASCKMPSTAQTQRNLRSATRSELIEVAEQACAGKNPEDIDFCVYDVLATEDIGMAGVW